MKEFIATLALAVAIPFAGLTITTPAQAADRPAFAKRQYPVAQQEDDANAIWLNEGPGFSFVSGPNRDDGTHRVVRVSDRLAHKLAARHGTWLRPGGWLGTEVDGVHGGTFVVTKRTVVSVGDTTYFIRNGRVASS